ncbi:hypothetical protein [Nonomuraea sp. NPDC050202]|uniref:hypothetical protein n=1 Tax=Nonomuraea sp. NPDC050202 TaxID=3155035 RepID=UPI0033ECDACB
MRATLARLERDEQAPPPMKAPRRSARPSSPAQLGRLRGWAERLPGQARGDALALMAPAFGCGLTSGEVAAVRTGHLRRLDSVAVVVTVPGAERLIICRTAWEGRPGPRRRPARRRLRLPARARRQEPVQLLVVLCYVETS